MKEHHDFMTFFTEMATFCQTGLYRVNLFDQSGYANDEWYNHFGVRRGLTLAELFDNNPNIHPVDRYSVHGFMQNAKRGYEKQYKGYIRVRIPGRDTSWRWLQCNMKVMKYAPDEGVVDVWGANYEVTSLIGEDEKTANAVSHYSDVLHSLNIIPWTLDIRTHVIISNLQHVNHKYVKNDVLKQMSLEEFVEFMQPEFREEFLYTYDRFQKGMVPHVVMQVQLRLGPEEIPVWVELNIVAQETDEHGTVTSAVGSTTIIQKRKEAEFAMLNAQRKAEQANMVKNNFLASMTHEFRTPLNAILGFSTIMAHSETIEERMQCLGAVQSSGTLLTQIIDDVIELSKLEAKEVELRHNLVNINNLIAKVVDEVRPMRKAGVEMTYHPTEASTILHGDEKKIELVMKHVLNNACKYTEKGSIDVFCHKNSENAVITVADTGRGMTQENINHIFERFYKGNSFVPGTGLGMPIVKGLIDLWKGTIKVESKVDVGTTVTFTIPLFAAYFQNKA